MTNQKKVERLTREGYLVTEHPHMMAKFVVSKDDKIWVAKNIHQIFKPIFGY